MSDYEEIQKPTSSIDDALSALTDALRVREKDLDAREKQMEQDQQGLDRDRKSTYGDTCASDVLPLNIGGVPVTVLRRTLTTFPESMLASKFSGRWDDSIEKDEQGHYFIDQEYPLFRHILKYLRNKANGDEKYVVQSPALKESEYEDYSMHDLYRMIDYYGLTNGMYPVALKVHGGDFVDGMNTKKVHAEEWTTYSLATKGHERRVQTYEVTLGNVQRVQLGWSRHLACSLPLDKNLTIGIGDTINTYALDLTRSSFLTDGRITPVDDVDNLNQNEGTVVRSEDFRKYWYINGDFVLTDTDYSGGAEMFPFLSVKGEIEVAVVELQK